MKTESFALIFSALLTVASARAADLPSHKAPPPIPLASTTWTGFYVGLNAGGAWSASHDVAVGSVDLFDDPLWLPGVTFAASANGGLRDVNAAGFIGGGQIGYNYQFHSHLLVGLEADIQGISSGGDGRAIGSAFNNLTQSWATTTTSVQKRLDYFGTARGRVGFLLTPDLLVYATGGLAYGGARLTASQSSSDQLGFYGPGAATGSYGDTRVGWTVGGGAEWMFAPKWSAKIGYLYYDLGSATTSVGPVSGLAFTFNMPPNSVGWSYASNVSSRFDGHIVRAGVNYHFD
jgi:outer membrane immunogenic protein